MIALGGSGDITAALEGSITSLMGEPGNQSLLKLWRQQVTRINVVRRFTRTYSAKSFQCDIAPGLTAASPQKCNTSEGSETRSLSTEVLNSGALFSPNTPIQDSPKQKFKSEKKNVEGYSFKLGDVFKDHRVLSPIQILVTGLTSQIKEADLLSRRIIVTVIGLPSRQEGTTASYNHVVWTALKGLFFLLWLSTFENCRVNAQEDSEDGKREYPNERVDLPYIILACTILAGIFMIAVIAGRIYLRYLAAAPPAVRPPTDAPLALPAAVAAPHAVRPPTDAPLAVPAAVDAPPTVRPPIDAPLAMQAAVDAPPVVRPPADAPLAVPAAADAPPAVRPPADAPLAVPAAADAPPAVRPPGDAPLAMPAAADAPPAVRPPGDAPLAVPAAADAPPAVPVPAILMGFVDVMHGLEDPTPARKSELDFDIPPPLQED